MPALSLVAFLLATAPELAVHTDFPGGSGEVVMLDSEKRSITIQPTPVKDRGWVCWWHVKITGVKPGETLTFRVSAASGFARGDRAFFSSDGKTWTQTATGEHSDKIVSYTVPIPEESDGSIRLAWGPPYQLADAKAAVERVAAANVGAKVFELCKSRDGHSVPALEWKPKRNDAPGIWIQARQHAWESGGSWVAQGVLDFLASDDPQAKWLRDSAHIIFVPIMDVDNVERGAGGKEGKPQDHNRDWSDTPYWPEVAAAQRHIKAMDAAGRFVLFLDLHNPAPGDKVPFFFGPPDELNPAERSANQERFYQLAAMHLGREPLKLAAKQRISGANYDRRWKVISKNWVASNTRSPSLAFTLETAWNTPNSTVDGYRRYGRALGKTIAEYLEVIEK